MVLALLPAALLMAGPPAAAASATAPIAADDKIRCRTSGITGSLVGGRRICKTVRDWRKSDNRAVDEVRDMQDRGAINSVNAGG